MFYYLLLVCYINHIGGQKFGKKLVPQLFNVGLDGLDEAKFDVLK